MIDKEFFKGFDPNRLQNEIAELTAETDAITAKIDAEETKKEIDKKISKLTTVDEWFKDIAEPIEKKKQEIDQKLFALDGIMYEDLPVYKKRESMTATHIVKIRNKQGRIEVDKLTIDNYGRVDFNPSKIKYISEDYTDCDSSVWNEGLEDLFKYLSDDK